MVVSTLAVPLCAAVLVSQQGATPGPTDTAPRSSTIEPITSENQLQSQWHKPTFGEIVESMFHYGPLVLRPGLSYSPSYSDNIFAGQALKPGTKRWDIIHKIDPDFSFTLENPATREALITDAGYSPEFVFLNNNTDRNTINHFGRLTLVKEFSKTTIGLVHNSSSVQDIFAEAAALERQDSHQTKLNIKYELGGRSALESSTSQNFLDRVGALSSKDWREDLWFNYALFPKLDVAVGVSGGYTSQDPGPESLMEGEQVRLRYYPTEKLRLEARGGVEWRSFQGPGGLNTLAPSGGLSATYAARQSTEFSLDLTQQSQASYYITGQMANYSSVGLTAKQNFYQNWFVSLTGLYAYVTFDPGTSSAPQLPSYNFYQIRSDFGYKWSSRVVTSGYYRHLARGAGAGYEGFDSNEIGLTLAYHF